MACDYIGRIAILGLGSTGFAVADWALAHKDTEIASIDVYPGLTSTPSEHSRRLEEQSATLHWNTEELVDIYDLAIVSPGIPEHSGFMASAKSHAQETIGDIELAWRESTQTWLAITGTNGKTTTTTLLTALLNAQGYHASPIGNIGKPALSVIDDVKADGWLVAELSSFQLAGTNTLKPRVAALLNITPDHLSWHGSFEAYCAAKERIFASQDAGDLSIISIDDEACASIAKRLHERGLRVAEVSLLSEPASSYAAFIRNHMLMLRFDGTELELCHDDELAIHGLHNIENALVAAAAAYDVGVSLETIRATLSAFAPLEHRIEPCGSHAGISFINDSKATNTDAVEKALQSFPAHTVVLMAGGHDKDTDLSSLAGHVAACCKTAICYGEAGGRLADAFKHAGCAQVVLQPHMAEAFEAATQVAEPGDVVLLSPACSSFDEFSGFEERGRVFKELVRAYIAARKEGSM